jgi:Domain of unknown function (DUF4382)
MIIGNMGIVLNSIDMKKTVIALAAFVILALNFMAGCKKSEQNSTRFELYLTDNPANYKSVWINIQEVRINATTDSSGGWQTVPLFRPGLYDLLRLRNGNDTLIAAIDLPAGRISQIRLVLGNGNYVEMLNGSTKPLETPSAQQSGLKLNVQATLQPGIPYALVLDFDAARSIVETGNGKLMLKPVIKTFPRATGGAIEGIVLPPQANPTVGLVRGADTSMAIPSATGFYKFWGLNAGTYTLIYKPDSATGFTTSQTRTATVTTGNTTRMDTVRLQ